MTKKERVLDLSIKLESLIPLVDIFVQQIDDADLELMEEVTQQLSSEISHNEAATVLITAMGGHYDSAEDEMKLKTIEHLVCIVKARKEAVIKIKEAKQKEIKRREVLSTLGIF